MFGFSPFYMKFCAGCTKSYIRSYSIIIGILGIWWNVKVTSNNERNSIYRNSNRTTYLVPGSVQIMNNLCICNCLICSD